MNENNLSSKDNEKKSHAGSTIFGILVAGFGALLIYLSKYFFAPETAYNLLGIIFVVGGIILIIFGIMVIKAGFNVAETGASMEDGILTISNRTPSIAKIVMIHDDTDAIVKYEPEKIHFGSATVGGVTTGGVYTTGGYNYLAGQKKNGRYKLCALGETIQKIKLNDEQYLIAKNSTISKYLNCNQQIQVIDNPNLTNAEAIAMFQTLKQNSFMYGGEAMKRGYPSYEKCVEILDWLCGIDNRNTDKEMLSSENEWKCPKCGKIHHNYVGSCGCGESKPRK